MLGLALSVLQMLILLSEHASHGLLEKGDVHIIGRYAEGVAAECWPR